MANDPKVGDLESPSDLAHQRATWAWQRRAWVVMAAILLLALLGLFGDGPLGSATVGRAGGPRVDYPRFCRLESPAFLDVFTTPGVGGEARVWVARNYADAAEFDRVEPTPDRVEASPDGLSYVMTARPDDRPARVRFHFSPGRPGILRGRIKPGDGPLLEFTQFVHP